MLDQFGGRKFIGFLAVCALLTLLVLANKITGDAFTLFLTTNFGIYVGGNVGETIITKEPDPAPVVK